MSLLWLANTTRPDISNAVRGVARRTHDPSNKSWRAVTQILEYFEGTRETGPTYRKAGGCRIEAFAEASCAEDEKDRLSVSGTVVMFGGEKLSCGRQTHRPT